MDKRVLHQDVRGSRFVKHRAAFRLRSTIAVYAAVFVGGVVGASAAPLPGRWCEPVGISVVEQDLRHLLGAIARKVGAAVQVTAGVRGVVRGPLNDLLPPGRFLDELGDRYAFNWYLSGGIIYASTANEIAWRVLGLGAVPRRNFEVALDDFGLLQARWPLRYGPRDTTVLVSGPPTYVAQVERVLAAAAATGQRGATRSVAPSRATPGRPPAVACDSAMLGWNAGIPEQSNRGRGDRR
jgi:type II secretory pathway component GspD/PulD (secretin)